MVIVAEYIQRQKAVLVAVAMEESTQLVTVNRIVGGIEVQHDPRRRCRALAQERLHEEIMDLVQIHHDLLVAVAPSEPTSIARIASCRSQS